MPQLWDGAFLKATMNQDPKNQAVIYARFSPRRNEDECESIETQYNYCDNYCKFHNLEILGHFRDDGLSGANAVNRPGLQEAIRTTIAHKAILVIYSLSRLARNTRETIEISEKLDAAKANLCSCTENIDTSTAMGDAFFKIIAVLAELERKQISERTRDAMLFHQANGRRMSHRLPFGFKLDPEDPNRIVLCEYEQNVITRVLTMYGEQLSLRKIAKRLEEEGFVPRPSRKLFKGKMVDIKGKWHHTTVRMILKRKL